MNNINVTVELCAEDRARLDKIIEGLGALRPDCSACVKGVAEYMDKAADALDAQKTEKEEAPDDINEMLKKALNEPAAESPKNAQDEPKASEHPTLDPFPEAPTAKAEASETSVKEVTAAELQQLAIALCRQKKQPDIKKVLSEYGVQTVSEVLSKVPEDKRYEVYEKLKALEG